MQSSITQRTNLEDLHDQIDKKVMLMGWVDTRRDHGKLTFIDLREATGKVQMVSKEGNDAHEIVSELRPEWVIKVTGKVTERPEKMVNEDEPNGDLEVQIESVEVLNEAETPPFDIYDDGYEIDEKTRLKYRYLDLRRPRLQKNIRLRDQVITFFRGYMHKNGFTEIETPILTADTPEGSREYVVPSRLHTGEFYALPQSPQQFKQLAMISGFERYFQIARCMRDEDLRGDRQPEFTQLDYEMSFVTQEDLLTFTEAMFIALVEQLFPDKKILNEPFPRLTYEQAMMEHGSDKPDLRESKDDPDELAFAWIVDYPMFEKMEDGSIQSMHHPFCSIKEEDKEKFMQDDLSEDELLNIRADAYDLVLNGYEISSGSIRIHEHNLQKRVFELLNISEEDQTRRFGHMLEALSYGAPPHGGFAPGIDRTVMILAGEPNIREVIPFPKTGEAKDPLMNAPAPIEKSRLKELGIKVIHKENEEE